MTFTTWLILGGAGCCAWVVLRLMGDERERRLVTMVAEWEAAKGAEVPVATPPVAGQTLAGLTKGDAKGPGKK